MTRKLRTVSVLAVVGIVALSSVSSWGLTDAELIAVRDGFDGRRDQMLAAQVADPYPVNSPVWCNQDYALAALYLDVEPNAANAAVIEACNLVLNDPNCPANCSLHWKGNLFYRIYEYFKQGSSYFPGRLTPEAEAKICEVMWFYAQGESFLADAATEPYKTWTFWSSENHTAQHYTTNWSAAAILKDVAPYNTYTYNDGSTAQEQYDAWTAFFKEYLRERAKRGLLLEIGSHTYSKYTLQGWYNFYDFAEDEVLRARGGMLLDLWWADWAQDQIDAVRGGGKIRVYQKYTETGTSDAAYAMCWYGLGIGTAASKHPGVMCLATSTYRPPLVVIDIALDVAGRGVYESKSRRPGKRLLPIPDPLPPRLTNILDWNNGGIYRYTYCTPDFVLGSLMVDKRANADWMAGSAQNRWQGAIFKGADNGRIFPQCVPSPTGYENTYNQHWSVQNKGTMIVQRLSTSEHAGDMRVFFSSDYLTLTEENGWVFAEAYSAYAAVKPAWGGYVWDDNNWLRCSDRDAPVIFEVARASDYMDMFAVFKMAVGSQTIDVTNDVLTYTGLGGSGTLTFYTASGATALPEIDGVPINITPDHTFDGGFIHEDWASGVVTISKDSRQLVLDFNGGAVEPNLICGDWGYFAGDINRDCNVDGEDIARMAAEWMEDCTSLEAPTEEFTDDDYTVGLWHFDSTYLIGSDVYHPDDDSAHPGRDRDMKEYVDGDPYINLVGSGKWGNCVNIDDTGGVNYYMLHGQLWPADGDTFRYQGWFRFADGGDLGGYLCHVYDQVHVHVYSVSDDAIFRVHVSGDLLGDPDNYVEITASLPDTTAWQYVEAVYDGSAIVLMTETETVTAAGIGPIVPNSRNMYIGSRKNKNRFTGLMDEVKMSTVGPGMCTESLDSDLNSDGKVNLEDFGGMGGDWMRCTNPNVVGCIDTR